MLFDNRFFVNNFRPLKFNFSSRTKVKYQLEYNLISRRRFLKNTAAAVTAGFAGLYYSTGCSSIVNEESMLGYGDLLPDPDNILDLPKGFTYTVLSRTGDKMDDGLLLPGAPDAMATFLNADGTTILIRNHELSVDSKEAGAFGKKNELLDLIANTDFYDIGKNNNPSLGGTTTLTILPNGKIGKQFLSLAGTVRNCAGGATPWGSWITCEESVQKKDEHHQKDHGYNFEVPAGVEITRANPEPLTAMGRFNHEAVAVDPDSGIVYQTEDRGDSLIYRFIPNEQKRLSSGGRLQALAIVDAPSLDTRNWDKQEVDIGQPMETYWIDVENIQSPEDDLRVQGHAQGAALFARGEGMWYGSHSIYFACTNGGPNKKGQVWRYFPSKLEGTADEHAAPGKLQLFIEPNNEGVVDHVDNLTIAPWGDVILCEDGSDEQFLLGVNNSGEIYKLARNSLNNSELAGAVFAPDGQTLYVNIQRPGLTIAIRGPWIA